LPVTLAEATRRSLMADLEESYRNAADQGTEGPGRGTDRRRRAEEDDPAAGGIDDADDVDVVPDHLQDEVDDDAEDDALGEDDDFRE
jgi:hypothetical protein